MARDRTGSSLNPYMEDTLFVGARIPDTIRRMVKQVSKLDKASFRKILQGKLHALYGSKLNCIPCTCSVAGVSNSNKFKMHTMYLIACSKYMYVKY